jgi:hypothetical protein
MANPQTYWRLYAWSIDLVRKLYEMGRIRKWLFRLIIGRYAWTEYVGLIETLGERECLFGYGLEGCEYHKHPHYLKEW